MRNAIRTGRYRYAQRECKKHWWSKSRVKFVVEIEWSGMETYLTGGHCDTAFVREWRNATSDDIIDLMMKKKPSEYNHHWYMGTYD